MSLNRQGIAGHRQPMTVRGIPDIAAMREWAFLLLEVWDLGLPGFAFEWRI